MNQTNCRSLCSRRRWSACAGNCPFSHREGAWLTGQWNESGLHPHSTVRPERSEGSDGMTIGFYNRCAAWPRGARRVLQSCKEQPKTLAPRFIFANKITANRCKDSYCATRFAIWTRIKTHWSDPSLAQGERGRESTVLRLRHRPRPIPSPLPLPAAEEATKPNAAFRARA